MPLKVNEIFYSIQGESSLAGQPCVFIRLTGCNLKCSYCDTTYAYEEGRLYEIHELIEVVKTYECKLIEVTGGEPLIQKETPLLIDRLISNGFKVLMETNGSLDISQVTPMCIKIVDVKCPSSGEHSHNDAENLNRLSADDELKFVIGDRVDYEFACDALQRLKSKKLSVEKIHFSPVFGRLSAKKLARWILEDRLEARLQLQLHKYIWDPTERGV